MKSPCRWAFALLLTALSSLSAVAFAYPPASYSLPHSWLGVTVRAVSFDTLASLQIEYGLRVAEVFPGSPAARSGVQRGDILLELGGKPLYSVGRLNWLLREAPDQETLPLTYFRNGRTETVDIELTQLAPRRPSPVPWGLRGWLSGSYLGVHLQTMTNELRDVFGAPEGQGVLIVKVMPDSPAQKAHLAVGDVIVRMDRKIIRRIPDVHRVLAFFEPGDTVDVEIIRNSQRRVLTATVIERPEVESGGENWEPPAYSPPPAMQPRHWRQLLEEFGDMWEKLWRELSEDRAKRAPEYL